MRESQLPRSGPVCQAGRPAGWRHGANAKHIASYFDEFGVREGFGSGPDPNREALGLSAILERPHFAKCEHR